MASRFRTSLRNPARRALLALALPLLAGSAFAQAAWPTKPITIIVPFPAGGPTDTATRIIGQKMSLGLKQPVLIDNRSGASGTIGAAAAAKAAPDGYTLVMLATPTLLAGHLYGPTSYDIFKNFTPVGTTYDLPIVMVVNPKALPEVTGLQPLIARAKADGGKFNYTTAGAGSFGHLTTESLKNVGKFEMQHVPYRGSAPAVTDLIGGQVPMMFSDLIAVLPHIRSGTLRPIAVGSSKRLSLLPDVKTVAEQGFPGFDATSWGGMLAPAGTPKDVIARLNAELKKALADKEVQAKLEGVGTFAAFQTPEQMSTRMHQDYERWGKVIRDNNIKNQ